MLYNRSSRTRKIISSLKTEPESRQEQDEEGPPRPAEFERGGADSRTHEDRTRLRRNRRFSQYHNPLGDFFFLGGTPGVSTLAFTGVFCKSPEIYLRDCVC